MDALKKEIRKYKYLDDIDNVEEWGGADVIISATLTDRIKNFIVNQPTVINLDFESPQFIPVGNRVVITKHSKELSWLFYKLKEVFRNYIDFTSKFQFYGMLAVAAQNQLHDDQKCEAIDLLLTVLEDGAWKFYLYFESIDREIS